MLVSLLTNPDNLEPTMVEVVPGVKEAYFETQVNERVPGMMQ